MRWAYTRLSFQVFGLCSESIVDADAIENEAGLLFSLFESFVYFELFH